MLKLMQRAALFLILSTGIPSSPMLMAQQQPMPSAPIPAQILAAKRVFISNGGDDDWTIPHQIHVPTLTYNQFYADIKSWGKYELVPSPADADVVFEIRSYDSREARLQVHLSILDPKTHVTLWSLTQEVEGASRTAIARKNFDEGMSALVGDLRKLVAGSL
jgi:non-ribosomal peptide synthetase component F